MRVRIVYTGVPCVVQTIPDSLPNYLRDPTRSVDSFRRDVNFFFSFY